MSHRNRIFEEFHWQCSVTNRWHAHRPQFPAEANVKTLQMNHILFFPFSLAKSHSIPEVMKQIGFL